MIKAILVFNNHGKPRLSKFYQYFVSSAQHGAVKFDLLKAFFLERRYAAANNKRNVPASV